MDSLSVPQVGRTAYQSAVRSEIRLTPEDVLVLVAEPLHEVEKEFRRNLASELDLISAMGGYIAESGGKRIRPALLLLASRALGYEGTDDILFAAVFEFIHTATLVHDDVIDEADFRRGRRSVNSRWGNTPTILFGDYLYSRSLSMALAGEDLRILGLMSRVTLRMIEGELMQTRSSGCLELAEEEYLDMIDRKTARMFAGCCEAAALLAQREEWLEPLRVYGRGVGVAYQLVDDLLDLTSQRAVLGKPVGSDLREGKLTLPVIDLLARRPSFKPTVNQIVEQPGDSAEAYACLMDGLHHEGCLERTQKRALKEAATAREALSGLPASPYRDALQALPDLLVSRKF